MADEFAKLMLQKADDQVDWLEAQLCMDCKVDEATQGIIYMVKQYIRTAKDRL